MAVEGLKNPALVNSDGMYIFGSDGKKVRCKVDLHVCIQEAYRGLQVVCPGQMIETVNC